MHAGMREGRRARAREGQRDALAAGHAVGERALRERGQAAAGHPLLGAQAAARQRLRGAAGAAPGHRQKAAGELPEGVATTALRVMQPSSRAGLLASIGCLMRRYDV